MANMSGYSDSTNSVIHGFLDWIPLIGSPIANMIAKPNSWEKTLKSAETFDYTSFYNKNKLDNRETYTQVQQEGDHTMSDTAQSIGGMIGGIANTAISLATAGVFSPKSSGSVKPMESIKAPVSVTGDPSGILPKVDTFTPTVLPKLDIKASGDLRQVNIPSFSSNILGGGLAPLNVKQNDNSFNINRLTDVMDMMKNIMPENNTIGGIKDLDINNLLNKYKSW
jgi:hypothetical protein